MSVYLYDEKSKIRSFNIFQHFSLNKWYNNNNNSKFIVSCRSQVLNDSEKITIFSFNKEKIIQNIYLSPFSQQKIQSYIEQFSNVSETLMGQGFIFQGMNLKN